MKHLKFFALIFLSFLIVQSNSIAQTKIAYVSKDVVIKQMPEYKKVEDEYSNYAKLYADTLATKENEIKSKAENFKKRYEEAQELVKSGKVKKEEDIKKLEDEIGELQKELQGLDEAYSLYKQKIQNDLYQKQNELLKPLIDKMNKTVEEVAKEMKINLVLNKTEDVIIYGDKELDITFKVLDKLK